MSIRDDAKTVLEFIYATYVETSTLPGPEQMLSNLEIDGSRIDRALRYLRDSGTIDIVYLFGSKQGLQNFHLGKITRAGIDFIEQAAA